MGINQTHDQIKGIVKKVNKTFNGLPVYELEFSDNAILIPNLIIEDLKTGEVFTVPIFPSL